MARFPSTKFGISFLVLVTGFRFYHCLVIDDFGNGDVSNWMEISDSRFHDGQSMVSFVTRPVKEGYNAVLFTLLVPCRRNASFAGIVKSISVDISDKSNVVLKIRGQGDYRGYEIILRHNGDFGDSVPSYVTYFEAPETEFKEITFPIDEFRAYRQGRLVSQPRPLNKKAITSIGILAYGGLHRQDKQIGAAALEIEWIRID